MGKSINQALALDISLISIKNIIFIKDIKSSYLDLTQTSADLFGWASPDYGKGKREKDNKIISSMNKFAIYIMNREHSPLPLTPRQEACVFLLIRGKTLKEIAYILGISVRTVESYIELIKHKLDCNNKGQVIEKALDAGFLHYIPEEFL